MKSKSHLKLRALCEGAVMVALAQVLSYVKLFELPQGGSVGIGTAPAGASAPVCSQASYTASCS